MENEKGKSEIWVQSKKAFDADKETFVLFLLPKDCEWQRSLNQLLTHLFFVFFLSKCFKIPLKTVAIENPSEAGIMWK